MGYLMKSNEMLRLPDAGAIPITTLRALNRLFPDRCPNPSDTDRDIWMKVGARRVVEFILSEYEIATGAPADVHGQSPED